MCDTALKITCIFYSLTTNDKNKKTKKKLLHSLSILTRQLPSAFYHNSPSEMRNGFNLSPLSRHIRTTSWGVGGEQSKPSKTKKNGLDTFYTSSWRRLQNVPCCHSVFLKLNRQSVLDMWYVVIWYAWCVYRLRENIALSNQYSNNLASCLELNDISQWWLWWRS